MSQATLNGMLVDDAGEACEVGFQWGSTTAYGMNTPFVGGYTAGMTFSATITGLAEGQAYHYRSVARNSKGVFYGQDMTFSTRSSGHLPVMIADDLVKVLLDRR